jgi:hypothetical protein
MPIYCLLKKGGCLKHVKLRITCTFWDIFVLWFRALFCRKTVATGSIFTVDDSLLPIYSLPTFDPHVCAKDDCSAFHNDLQSHWIIMNAKTCRDLSARNTLAIARDIIRTLTSSELSQELRDIWKIGYIWKC